MHGLVPVLVLLDELHCSRPVWQLVKRLVEEVTEVSKVRVKALLCRIVATVLLQPLPEVLASASSHERVEPRPLLLVPVEVEQMPVVLLWVFATPPVRYLILLVSSGVGRASSLEVVVGRGNELGHRVHVKHDRVFSLNVNFELVAETVEHLLEVKRLGKVFAPCDSGERRRNVGKKEALVVVPGLEVEEAGLPNV